MMAVANKSLVLLCFLLAIVASQAEAACIDVCIKSFAVSPSATARDVVAGCTAKCALVENQRKTIDALLVPKSEDYNRTKAAVVEKVEKLTEEMISLSDELKKSDCPTTAARNCYNACRFIGTSRPTCAKLCGCNLTGTEAALVEEVEKLTEEMISLSDELKKSECPTTAARNCYNACRFIGTSRPTCAKLCGCNLTRTEAAIVEEVEKLTEEMISLSDELKKSECPTTAARNCYNACRFIGTSRPTCAKLCGCNLTGTEAAIVEEVEKLTEETISLSDELKKSECPTTAARNCYNTCRFIGTSRPTCAKLCGCTLTGTEAAVVEEVEKLTEETISLNDELKMSNCPTTAARNCYNACPFAGGIRLRCAKLCGCTPTGTEAAVVEEEEKKEKLKEELISLNDELKKVNCPSTTAQNCYDICRMTPQGCARRCGCTLTGKRWLTAKI